MRIFLTALLLSSSLFAAEEEKTNRRLDDAAVVLSEIMAAPDKGIPNGLLEKAHCIVIVPGLKVFVYRLRHL
jgi:lipid-binding SYLF domain-containing protein